jgi:hypothetical protein
LVPSEIDNNDAARNQNKRPGQQPGAEGAAAGGNAGALNPASAKGGAAPVGHPKGS